MTWVRSATVARRLPDTVLVRLEEYVPFALWQQQGRFVLIDRRGELIVGGDDPEYGRDAVARFANLPLVVGTGAPAMAAPLLDTLAGYPDIAVRMQAAVRISDRRWDLTLAPGIRVSLPEHDWRIALARLASMHADERLLDRAVAEIDLRLPDRVVLMPAPPAEDGRGRKDGRA